MPHAEPRPLRIGILGVARISGEAVVLPAQALGHRLVAVASRDPQRARFFADLCGVERVHEPYEALLADPEVDVVYIPQPNALHARWTLAAIAAGKHVLCEKPLTLNAAEAEMVRDAALAAGVHVHEAYHHLCHPLYSQIQDILDSGRLGALTRVEASVTMGPPAPADPRWSAELGGGALLDLGCYGLQVHHWLGRWAGEPQVESASAVPGGAGLHGAGLHGGVDAAAQVRLRFASGATGLVRASMIATEKTPHTLRIDCERGAITIEGFVLPHLGGSLTVTGRQERTVSAEATVFPGTTVFSGTTTYEYQLRRFAELIRAGRPMPAGLGDSVATMRLLDTARAILAR